MIIEQTFTVNAPQGRTAAFFRDIDEVGDCIPGVEDIREIEPGHYEATLAVRLGPIRAAFKGAIALDDSEAPKRLRASGEGRDRSTGSSAKVDFTADLAEHEPGVTTVSAAADVTIRGKLSQFGTGVMRAAASEMVREFAACANARLADAGSAEGTIAEPDGGASTGTPNASERSARPKQRGMVVIFLRGLLRSFAHVLRRVAERIEASLDGHQGAAR